jgi:PAS domain S-box-containing protein
VKSVDTVQQAVIVTDISGVIAEWNPAAEALYGWKADEVLGRNIVDVTPARGLLERAQEIMTRLRSGKSWGGQFRVRHRDGHEFEALVIDAPLIEGGELRGIMGISIPIEDGRAEKLTDREIEISTLTVDGKTSPEIATILGISVRTVESHRSNVYRKLGINSRDELAVIAKSGGLRK